MRILFVGDVMGRSGREALAKHLPDLKEKLRPDVIIVNGENAAHGLGISKGICEDFFELGVDCITTGNHVWDQREIIPYIANEPRLLRPLNFPAGTTGQGVWHGQVQSGERITVINAMCRLFMDPLDDPFARIKSAIEDYSLGQKSDAIFIDFHGEATSEKMALAHYLDGQVTAVVGTHTHMPTADYQVLPGGTAFQSDAGMTGDFDSVIGIRKDISIHRFTKKVPGERMIPADGEGTLCGTFIVTKENGTAKSIEPIRLGGRLSQAMPEA